VQGVGRAQWGWGTGEGGVELVGDIGGSEVIDWPESADDVTVAGELEG
jgi:hypothetical protein